MDDPAPRLEPDLVRACAELIAGARAAWVLTGAGMSTESGLPDYRGPAGMWKQRRFEDVASIDALRSRPEEFWDFYRMRLDQLAHATPNAGHRALARLQDAGLVTRVVTQNVDGLHQVAGSRDVVELHGSLRAARCRDCDRSVPIDEARARWAAASDGVPPCECGQPLGPGIVLFGEPMPADLDDAFDLAGSCDVVVAAGTSLAVYPAAHLPIVTVERGGRMAIVNRGRTDLDSLASIRIDGALGDVLPAVADLLLDRA